MAELLPEHSLLGMGNPLLDISATAKPELLTKHGLKANDAILTEEETIFNELRDGYKAVIAIAGCATLLHGNVLQGDHLASGATQNTVRGDPEHGAGGAVGSRQEAALQLHGGGGEGRHKVQLFVFGQNPFLLTDS